MEKLARTGRDRVACLARRTAETLAACLLAVPVTAPASTLQEILFNVNGAAYHNDYVVPGLNSAGWNDATGLGTLTLTFNPGAAGAYFFDVFFDHQLHVPYFNEYGAVSGAPAAGVSWQIDEPGFGDGNRLGTIFGNASANALDDTNHVPGTLSNFLNDCGGNTPGNPPDPACNNDVSMALGFNFILAADELAIITITASPTMPTGGFFLRQLDPDTPSDVFLFGTISIREAGTVAEPGTLPLVAATLVLLGGLGSRRPRTGS